MPPAQLPEESLRCVQRRDHEQVAAARGHQGAEGVRVQAAGEQVDPGDTGDLQGVPVRIRRIGWRPRRRRHGPARGDSLGVVQDDGGRLRVRDEEPHARHGEVGVLADAQEQKAATVVQHPDLRRIV